MSRDKANKDKEAFNCRNEMILPAERDFGPYHLQRCEAHMVITRHDEFPVEPTFWEMQHMKCMMFGGPEAAVEIFPPMKELFDGANYRHIWGIGCQNMANIKKGPQPKNKEKR